VAITVAPSINHICIWPLSLPKNVRLPVAIEIARALYMQAGPRLEPTGASLTMGIRIPDGCGAVHHRGQGPGGPQVRGTIRNAPSIPRIPAMAARGLHPPGGRTCCRKPTWNISAATAIACI
jgi:hypothetical protein